MDDHFCVVIFSDEPEWPPEQRGEFFGFISGKTNLTCEANAEPPAQVSNCTINFSNTKIAFKVAVGPLGSNTKLKSRVLPGSFKFDFP